MEQTSKEQTPVDNRTWEQMIEAKFEKAAADPEYAARKINAQWLIGFVRTVVIPKAITQWQNSRRPPRQTCIERIQVVMHRLGIDSVSKEEKFELGLKLKDQFFTDPKNLYLHRTKMSEPDGDFEARIYPAKFVPVMDAIIYQYFNAKYGSTNPYAGIDRSSEGNGEPAAILPAE